MAILNKIHKNKKNNFPRWKKYDKTMDALLMTRGRAVAARRAHNPEVVGSNPTPATKFY